jgi:hypothetical protein
MDRIEDSRGDALCLVARDAGVLDCASQVEAVVRHGSELRARASAGGEEGKAEATAMVFRPAFARKLPDLAATHAPTSRGGSILVHGVGTRPGEKPPSDRATGDSVHECGHLRLSQLSVTHAAR